jgi:hypothetical protein
MIIKFILDFIETFLLENQLTGVAGINMRVMEGEYD